MANTESLRVLCIEDDVEVRILLKRNLEALGIGADTVWNGEKGLEAAASGTFDCILLDLLMPGMDGFQVLRKLAEHPLTSRLPVIVLTARDDEEARRQALDAGASVYMVKPINFRVLADTIREWAAKNRK
jgi:DNA-binding response OmpR family regulator